MRPQLKSGFRLFLTIGVGLLDEAAVLIVVLWLLPRLGVRLPVWLIVICVLVCLFLGSLSVRATRQALRLKPLAGLPDMEGLEGTASGRLDPRGFVKIQGELWAATAEGGTLEDGAEVVVTGRTGLQLKVKARASVL